MAVGKSTKIFMSGKVKWAKIVGDRALVPNYDGDSREWTFDFYPESTDFLKENKLLDRLKTDKDGEDYIRFKKPEFDKEGNKNEPYRIYNNDDEPWDDRLIGNGSDVDVKIDIRDYGSGKKKGLYASALRVTELVEFKSNEFAGMASKGSEAKPSKPVKKAPGKTVLEDLDDDLPF